MDSKIETIAREARDYVDRVIIPIYRQEPLLHVPTIDYDFRVRFPGKHEVPAAELLKEAVAIMEPGSGVSLYAHIPQCSYRCNFCTYAVTLGGNEEEDAGRLIKELDDLSVALPLYKANVSSLYFGGGTPTTLSPEEIYKLVRGFADRLPITPETEVSMEGSPDTITREKITAAHNAGVTRFSVGVQTFDEAALEACNRGHSSKQAEDAVKLLTGSDFQEVNVDLMRGLPYQTLELFVDDLLRIIEYRPETLHVYRMRVRRKNQLQSKFEHNVDRLKLPSTEETCAMQYAADRLLAEYGYKRQHTAGWSMTSPKVFSDRWQQQIPLISFGWRAYSLFQFGEWHNSDQLGSWRSQVDQGKPAIKKAWKYDPNEAILRRMLFQLKTMEGFRNHQNLPEEYRGKLGKLEELGVIESRGDSFVLTDAGFMIGEEAIRYLSVEY